MCLVCDRQRPGGVHLDAELLESLWREHHEKIEEIVGAIARKKGLRDHATIQEIVGGVREGLTKYTAPDAKPITKGWKAVVRPIAYRRVADHYRKVYGRPPPRGDAPQADHDHDPPRQPRETPTKDATLAERHGAHDPELEPEMVEARVYYRELADGLLRPCGLRCPASQDGLSLFLDQLATLVRERPRRLTKQAALGAFSFALAGMPLPPDLSDQAIEEYVQGQMANLRSVLWPDSDERHAQDSLRQNKAWAIAWARRRSQWPTERP